MAKAGINRLEIDLKNIVTFELSFNYFLPAPAQGALAVQMRAGDSELEELLKKLNHRETEMSVSAERFFLKFFGGGCHIPLGALASVESGEIHLSGVVASVDGERAIRKSVSGEDPVMLGEKLARLMKEEGADRLI